jgi:hypothetical protein
VLAHRPAAAAQHSTTRDGTVGQVPSNRIGDSLTGRSDYGVTGGCADLAP